LSLGYPSDSLPFFLKDPAEFWRETGRDPDRRSSVMFVEAEI
jgi:hypothetical protein